MFKTFTSFVREYVINPVKKAFNYIVGCLDRAIDAFDEAFAKACVFEKAAYAVGFSIGCIAAIALLPIWVSATAATLFIPVVARYVYCKGFKFFTVCAKRRNNRK